MTESEVADKSTEGESFLIFDVVFITFLLKIFCGESELWCSVNVGEETISGG